MRPARVLTFSPFNIAWCMFTSHIGRDGRLVQAATRGDGREGQDIHKRAKEQPHVCCTAPVMQGWSVGASCHVW